MNLNDQTAAFDEDLNLFHDISASQFVLIYVLEMVQAGDINSCQLQWMNDGRLAYLDRQLPKIRTQGFEFFREHIHPDDLRLMSTTLKKLEAHPPVCSTAVCYRVMDKELKDYVWIYAQVSVRSYFPNGSVREVLVNAFELPDDPVIIEQLMGNLSAKQNNELRLRFQSLSPQQKEIMSYIIRGYSDSRIADALGVGFNTIRSQHERIRQKIGVSNTKELITLAIQSGEFRDACKDMF